MAFGDVMIDAIGPARATPATSTVVGLLANALGICRWETRSLARLQDRVVFGSRLDRRGLRFTEFQTARLGAAEHSWTTAGRVARREPTGDNYRNKHLRYREHDADACVTIALRLRDADEPPTLEDLARALDEPARPLFLGRKPCLPSGLLAAGFVDAGTVHDALLAAPFTSALTSDRPRRPDDLVLMVLPADEPRPSGFRDAHACERRDWPAGIHAGDLLTYHGDVPRERFSAFAPTAP